MRDIAHSGRSPSFKPLVIGIASTVLLLAAFGWSATYLTGLKPPRCDDSRTLALVGYQLGRLLGSVPVPTLTRIRTVAGGALAIRFVCTAEFANPDQIRLPNGIAIRTIRFTSALGFDHAQQVTVRLEPILRWEQVE